MGRNITLGILTQVCIRQKHSLTHDEGFRSTVPYQRKLMAPNFQDITEVGSYSGAGNGI